MMIPFDGTVPYPYQEEIGIDEDGAGFALRMAIRNGITFSQLARKFASTGHLTLPASAAGALAFMFGSDPTRVQAAFMQRYVRGGASGVCFFGHDFRRPYHLRQTSPQVCPTCISLNSHASVAWSISMVTCCPTHGIRLLDHCACGRPIRWRRPSMDLCECGRRLTPSHQICRDATKPELAISSQVMYLLGPPHFRLRPCDALFSVFDRLSVDTFVRLIWILGIVDCDDPRRLPRCANKVLTTLEASMVCIRAYDRLALILNRGRSTIGFAVHQAALDALRAECSETSDIRILDSLATRMARGATTNSAKSRSLPAAQFKLFEDSHV